MALDTTVANLCLSAWYMRKQSPLHKTTRQAPHSYEDFTCFLTTPIEFFGLSTAHTTQRCFALRGLALFVVFLGIREEMKVGTQPAGKAAERGATAATAAAAAAYEASERRDVQRAASCILNSFSVLQRDS